MGLRVTDADGSTGTPTETVSVAGNALRHRWPVGSRSRTRFLLASAARAVGCGRD